MARVADRHKRKKKRKKSLGILSCMIFLDPSERRIMVIFLVSKTPSHLGVNS
jgi:hypothetical protein